MDSTSAPPEFLPAGHERRDAGQARNKRKSGAVVSVAGSRAVIATRMSELVGDENPFWSVGDLITIYGRRSRIICLVQDMVADAMLWTPESDNLVRANVELLGEVVDQDGKPAFRRGIAHYPALGSPVNRIRQADLVSIYDLGVRKASTIGQLVQADIPAVVDVEAMLRKHFAVVGTTGVGKSCSVSILLRAAIQERPQMRVVILDPHNEYSHAFRDVSATVGARAFELPFWLFQFDEFVEAVYRGVPAPAEETEFLREAIGQARDLYGGGADKTASVLKKTYRQADGGLSDAPRPYRINDVLAIIDAELGRLEQRHERSALRSLKARLENVSNDPHYRFMFGKAAVEAQTDFATRHLFRIHEASRPVTVLQMAGIPADVVNASVSVLARLAFDVSMESHGKHEFLLVCEEAHRYVPLDAQLGFAPTRRAIARIAKEGRKYGCYLGIVTQRPGELDPTILSQCSTVFAMRLANAADQEIIRSAIPDNSAGVLEFISALSNREAIAFGEAVATPMRMMFQFQDESHLPKMATDEEKPAPQPFAAERPTAPPPPQAPSLRRPDFSQITAPAIAARGAGSPLDLNTGTNDWPSSERMQGFGRR